MESVKISTLEQLIKIKVKHGGFYVLDKKPLREHAPGRWDDETAFYLYAFGVIPEGETIHGFGRIPVTCSDKNAYQDWHCGHCRSRHGRCMKLDDGLWPYEEDEYLGAKVRFYDEDILRNTSRWHSMGMRSQRLIESLRERLVELEQDCTKTRIGGRFGGCIDLKNCTVHGSNGNGLEAERPCWVLDDDVKERVGRLYSGFKSALPGLLKEADALRKSGIGAGGGPSQSGGVSALAVKLANYSDQELRGSPPARGVTAEHRHLKLDDWLDGTVREAEIFRFWYLNAGCGSNGTDRECVVEREMHNEERLVYERLDLIVREFERNGFVTVSECKPERDFDGKELVLDCGSGDNEDEFPSDESSDEVIIERLERKERESIDLCDVEFLLDDSDSGSEPETEEEREPSEEGTIELLERKYRESKSDVIFARDRSFVNCLLVFRISESQSGAGCEWPKKFKIFRISQTEPYWIKYTAMDWSSIFLKLLGEFRKRPS